MPAPPPPPLVVHNPEDDFDGFDYEDEQEDAASCVSESAVEGSDESADPE